jgi:cytochrome d ubiquinol oxidase subunit II
MELSTLWFILIAILWIGYLVLEGFDFGVGMLLKYLPKDEQERRVALNTIGPHWDGNEVWLLTAGGATFAAFPEWYATMFSGMYIALFLILVMLILRISALEWRPKVSDLAWRNRWDTIHVISAWVPAVLWGVAFANLVQGMDIEVVERDGTVVPPEAVDGALGTASHQLTGGFFSLLTPYTLLGGVVTASLFLTSGAIFLALKTDGDLRRRAGDLAARLSVVSAAVTAVFALWGQFAHARSALALIPLVVAALCLVAVVATTRQRKEGWSFLLNSVAIGAAVAWIFMALHPYVMPSRIDDAYSLSIVQASSTPYTLRVMTIVALTIVPVVIAYQAYTYWIFRRRLSTQQIPTDPAGLTLSELL